MQLARFLFQFCNLYPLASWVLIYFLKNQKSNPWKYTVQRRSVRTSLIRYFSKVKVTKCPYFSIIILVHLNSPDLHHKNKFQMFGRNTFTKLVVYKGRQNQKKKLLRRCLYLIRIDFKNKIPQKNIYFQLQIIMRNFYLQKLNGKKWSDRHKILWMNLEFN